MTEIKQFISKDKSIINVTTDELVNASSEESAKILVNWLNEFYDENEQLKQFQKKVFILFDKEITRNEEAIEWGKQVGADSDSIGFHNHMLKKLKKELKE